MTVFVLVDQGVKLLAFQECGPKGAAVVASSLGDHWAFFAGGSDDPVATFWDTTAATII